MKHPHMHENRKIITLTPSCQCNLNCSYCYVTHTKTDAAESRIIESFKDENYYFDFATRLVPNPNEVGRLELWGGEPLLHVERAFTSLEKLLNYYEKIEEFFFSTNFALKDAVNQLQSLIYILGKYKHNIKLLMQISLDGNTDIMESTRGSFVNKLIEDNFKNMIEVLDIPSNVKLSIAFKPTLPLHLYMDYFTTVNRYIDFVNYYNNFVKWASIRSNIDVNDSLLFIGIASPCEYTIEDGLKINKNIEAGLQAEIYARKTHCIGNFKYIIPYLHRSCRRYEFLTDTSTRGWSGSTACGSFKYVFNLYPDNYLGGCHRQIDDFINICNDDPISSKLIQPDTEFIRIAEVVSCAYDKHAQCNVGSVVSAIEALTKLGAISRIYADKKLALRAAKFITNVVGGCYYDNDSETGSFSTTPLGRYLLWLNGAEEKIMNFARDYHER